jgi:integrase
MSKERKGYIFEDKNGKWFARITFIDESGKRRNVKRTATTKPEAKDILKQLVRELEDKGSKTFDADKMTFNQLADYYEKHYLLSAQYVNGRKIAGLRDIATPKTALAVFRGYFGNRKIRSISYGDLLSFYRLRMNTMTRFKTKRTIGAMNRELGILRRIFNIAMREGWLNRNPLNCGEALIQPSADGIREKVLTLDEEERLLKACNEPCRAHIRPIVIALLDTGARRGEMLKLVWQDVNLDLRLITIQAMNTKTLRMRQVAITSRLFDELLQLWKKSDKNLNSLVFNIPIPKKSFRTACKIAGIKYGGIDGLVLHSLRHSAASRLVKNQFPIQLVGKILGHTNPSTTYRYITADTESLYHAASILESIQQTGDSEHDQS